MHDMIQQPYGLPELVDQVRQRLSALGKEQHDQRPALENELSEIRSKANGWSASLAKTDLAPGVRAAIEAQWADALERATELEGLLDEESAHDEQAEALCQPEQILGRLDRLADVLASNNPTMGNLELSLHIDRIECGVDGAVRMRTCKLGTLTDAVPLLSDPAKLSDAEPIAESETAKPRSGPRRRGRLRIEDGDGDEAELRALGEFVTDPKRFAGLGDEWFWTDTFQIPDGPLSWAAQNSEAVFRRRQEARLSYAKLGKEFGVTAPTARAAVQHYLDRHPEAVDEVRLRPGGKRPPKFDVSQFAAEARRLWESGWSKLKLAEKYSCSTPVIDKALAYAYAQDGLPVPTPKERGNEQVAKARQMLDEGCMLAEIAQALDASTATARQYLRESFAASGEAKPDLRKRRDPA